ncbi:unnamed protein product, partial [Ceratitis capitata]
MLRSLYGLYRPSDFGVRSANGGVARPLAYKPFHKAHFKHPSVYPCIHPSCLGVG